MALSGMPLVVTHLSPSRSGVHHASKGLIFEAYRSRDGTPASKVRCAMTPAARIQPLLNTSGGAERTGTA
jgi:hypothetical protein